MTKSRVSRCDGSARAPVGIALRLLSTTDVHGHLTGYDFFADRPSLGVGLTRTATLIAQARAEAANSLLFDSGDFLQGSAITDLAAQGDWIGPHPVSMAMNALAYDAAALGNHDFNYGLAVLGRALAEAEFPVLCANIAAEGLVVQASTLLHRVLRDETGVAHSLRIGVFGVAPPEIVAWDRQILPKGTTAEDMVVVARAQIAALRAEGADLVIGLCHTGIGPTGNGLQTDGTISKGETGNGETGNGGTGCGCNGAPADGEQVAQRIALLPGVDAVLAGHSHQILPPPGHRAVEAAGQTPVIVAGSWGGYLGVVDLHLRRNGSGWTVARSQSLLRPVAGAATGPVAEDPALSALLAPVQHRTRMAIQRPVGQTAQPLHSYFVLALPSRAEALIAEAKLDFLRRMLKGTAEAALPMLVATSPFKAGGPAGADFYTDIASGPLTLRSIGDLYLYPNAFCAICVDGAELRRWIEQAAGQFRQIVPGAQDAPLLDLAFPNHSFDILHGLTYQLDLTQPARFRPHGSLADAAASRVCDLRHLGQPVRDTDRFVVATNTYRTGGGGGYPEWGPDRVVLASTDRVRDILHAYLASGPPAAPSVTEVFRFKPIGQGTTALLRTGPGAAAHLAEAGAQGLSPAGKTTDGYLNFRLRL